MKPSALLVISQSPFDPASGAARSERTNCEWLARAGWQVRVVATTASESCVATDLAGYLKTIGVEAGKRPLRSGSDTQALRFRFRDVDYTLIDTGGETINSARERFADDMDAAVAMEIARGAPDLTFTYGSNARERTRRGRLRAAGSKIVFSVRNFAYVSPESFAETDAVITPSQFVSDHYARTHGIRSLALPLPVEPGDLAPVSRRPEYFTLINPTWAKGVDFFLEIVRECSRRHPDVRFLAVEARASRESIMARGARAGLQGEELRNLFVTANTWDASAIYAVTRVLLAPSQVEPAGRVVAEAQVNGIPVITSDRGGLPETVGNGGHVLPAETLSEWVNVIGRMHDEESFHTEWSKASLARAGRYHSGQVERERVAAMIAMTA